MKEDVRNLLAIANPHEDVVRVCGSVHPILGINIVTWDEVKKTMANLEENMDKLKNYDFSKVDE